jgi:hypothetical protein
MLDMMGLYNDPSAPPYLDLMFTRIDVSVLRHRNGNGQKARSLGGWCISQIRSL